MPKAVVRREFLGVPLDDVTMVDAVQRALDYITMGAPRQVLQVNVANLMAARKDSELYEIYSAADLVTVDGKGIMLGAALLRQPFKETVSGVFLMERLLEQASSRRLRVYLLGSKPEVLDLCAREIRRRYAGAVIAGMHHGYFSPEDEHLIVVRVNHARPDMIFVGMSTPLKERFICRYYRELGVPVCMGVGGSLEVLAGLRRRAPALLRALGLEWFYRFLQEPRRLWRRYFVGIPTYLLVLGGELVTSLISGRLIRDPLAGRSGPMTDEKIASSPRQTKRGKRC